MSVFKKLNKQDVIVVPYKANKTYVVSTDDVAATYLVDDYYTPDTYYEFNLSSSAGVTLYQGTNMSGSLFQPTTEPTYNGQYKRLIYDSIKQLYYSNFISSSYAESGSYNNYNQSTLTSSRYFPTASGSEIRVISIERDYVGTKIVPKTFSFSSSLLRLHDDGEGNIYDITSSLVGNIIYPHGLLIFTKQNYFNCLTSSFAFSYKGEHIIYETQYRCTIRGSEFNYTLNPSLATDNSGSVPGYANSSSFAPYITTLGLYNEAYELIAVGKFAQPIPISNQVDMTLITQIDK